MTAFYTHKHSNTEYLSVAECLRQNGYRHYCNGMKYLEQGLTQHARGSFAKAQRNYDRADKIDFVNENVWYNEICKIEVDAWNKLANNVAATIIGMDYGVQEITGLYYYMEDGSLIVRTVTDEEMYK